MNLIVLGPQGSGKGTQATLLENKGFFHMETGKLLREMAKTDPEVNEIINVRGELYPDESVIEMMDKHLSEHNVLYDNIVFDGYPRTVNQYDLLNKWLSTNGSKLDKVIFISISEEETVKRLSARRTCEKCGTVYNLITNPPPSGGCPCGGELVQREDDKPETIKKRLTIFREQTLPIVEKARDEGKLIEIDGERSIDEIQLEIQKSLERK